MLHRHLLAVFEHFSKNNNLVTTYMLPASYLLNISLSIVLSSSKIKQISLCVTLITHFAIDLNYSEFSSRPSFIFIQTTHLNLFVSLGDSFLKPVSRRLHNHLYIHR